MQDKITPKGKITFVKTSANGYVETKEVNNLVVTIGREWICERMTDDIALVMDDIALGTGSNAALLEDVALEEEVARVEMNIPGGSATSNVVTYSATFGPGEGTGELQEAGIFNAANVMLARTVYPPINKQPADSLSVTWQVSLV